MARPGDPDVSIVSKHLLLIYPGNHESQVQSGATIEGIARHSSRKALLVVSETFMASGGKVGPLTSELTELLDRVGQARAMI